MRRIILIVLILVVVIVAGMLAIPAAARHSYGPPAGGLTAVQVLEYSAALLWDDGLLTKPLDPKGPEQSFTVQQGEPIGSIADRLQQAGAIRDAGVLRDYLIYTGLDTSVQAGDYKVSPAMSIVDIANLMQDAIPSHVTFVVWPGWRMEEIGMSLPTSGLEITPYAFVAAASSTPEPRYDFQEGKPSGEGFLYPDSYVLPRTTTVDQLIEVLVRTFDLHLTAELREGFRRQGLSIYQAVTLASIVQRESVQDSEAPMIASVYLNRLRAGMQLDADPTIQYALGYNAVQGTWWTNPLAVADFQIASPYNTYTNGGLPPTPIDNPGPEALQAVANPASSEFFYFTARCDHSGYHEFARTFEEHLGNICP